MEPATPALLPPAPLAAGAPPRFWSRWPRHAARAVRRGLREALLYAAGSGDSRLRQIEALREMDPRMLRDLGLDLRDVMREPPKTGKKVPPGL